jgi:REP element-mobilizing transposase RayT
VPRLPRRALPTPAWYHVISRGVEKRRIMLDDLDREAWFKLFLRVQRRYGWNVVVWCLLDNHFHILVYTTQPELSAGMQRLNGIYAMRFNRRNDRVGHLFQGRFESRVVEDDEYFEGVVAYIYDNATRLGLRGWPWRGIAFDLSRPDYASPGHERRDAPERAPRRGNRPPQRRGRRPARRGARPLQRAGGARGPPRSGSSSTSPRSTSSTPPRSAS